MFNGVNHGDIALKNCVLNEQGNKAVVRFVDFGQYVFKTEVDPATFKRRAEAEVT